LKASRRKKNPQQAEPERHGARLGQVKILRAEAEGLALVYYVFIARSLTKCFVQ
jgi:hypothetical protein